MQALLAAPEEPAAPESPPLKTHSAYYRPAPSFRALKVIVSGFAEWISGAYAKTLGALFSHLSWNSTLYCALATALALIFVACALSVQAFRQSRGRTSLFSILAFGEAQERPSDFYIKDIIGKGAQSANSDSTKESEAESYPAPQRSFLRVKPAPLPRNNNAGSFSSPDLPHLLSECGSSREERSEAKRPKK